MGHLLPERNANDRTCFLFLPEIGYNFDSLNQPSEAASMNDYPAPTTPAGQAAEAIYQQGFDLYMAKNFAQALPLIETSLTGYREAQHMPGVLRALHVVGNIAFEQANYARARTIHEEVLAMCRAAGIQVGVASSLNNLAMVAQHEGKYAESRAYFEESIRLYEALGDQATADAVRVNLAALDEQEKGN
jgi:tetratricopeptide (TPR) repeat protein